MPWKRSKRAQEELHKAGDWGEVRPALQERIHRLGNIFAEMASLFSPLASTESKCSYGLPRWAASEGL